MTTLLLTHDFILADRSVTTDVSATRQRHTKIYKDKENRGALALIGYIPFKPTNRQYQNLFNALYSRCLYHDGVTKEEQETVDKVIEPILDTIVGDGTLYLLTSKNIFSYTKKYLEIGFPGNMFNDGTGGGLAKAFYTLGLDPEEIVEQVSYLDPFTTKEYDIVYAKDLL